LTAFPNEWNCERFEINME